MKRIIPPILLLVVIVALVSKFAVFSMTTGSGAFHGVKKINDGLYAGKVADDFYLAMERIDESNIRSWQDYARWQASGGGRMNLAHLPNTDGSAHFREVLHYYKEGKISPLHELWVVYASTEPVTKRAILKDENPTIEMFVTAITSPDAYLTSHMGISRSWEAALALQKKERAKKPNQSVHLHSFAAKVMKLLYPKKQYMVTVPNTVMRNILIKKLSPNSVFVGDTLYAQLLKEAKKNPVSLLSDIEQWDDETDQEYQERIREDAEFTYEYNHIPEKLSMLNSHPPRIIKTVKDGNAQLTVLRPDGSVLVSFNSSDPKYQWLFTDPYREKGTHLPYALVDLDSLAQAVSLEKF